MKFYYTYYMVNLGGYFYVEAIFICNNEEVKIYPSPRSMFSYSWSLKEKQINRHIKENKIDPKSILEYYVETANGITVLNTDVEEIEGVDFESVVKQLWKKVERYEIEKYV